MPKFMKWIPKMLYNNGNHAKLKCVQPQPSPLQGENGGKIYSAWNPGKKISFKRIKTIKLEVLCAQTNPVGYHSFRYCSWGIRLRSNYNSGQRRFKPAAGQQHHHTIAFIHLYTSRTNSHGDTHLNPGTAAIGRLCGFRAGFPADLFHIGWQYTHRSYFWLVGEPGRTPRRRS